MKILLLLLLVTSTNLYSQNKAELLLLLNSGKLNLVPKYGEGLVDKPSEYKINDAKFIQDAITQFGTRDSACQIYSSAGWDSYYMSDLRTAMKRFNQAWLLDSTNASEYFGFNAVLEIIKDNPHQFYQTPIVKIKSVENPDKYYKIATEYDINNKNEISALQFTSLVLERYGKSNEAFESCNKLLKINPNDTNGLCQRANLYSIKNDWENSLLDLNKAKLYKKDKEYLFNDIGYAYQSLKNFENAKLYYDKSSLENSEFLNPIYNNALLHLKIEQYLLALDYIDKCFSIKDNVPQFHKTKGEILIKLNRKEEGIVYLKKAKKMGDKDAKKIIKENK